MKIVNALWKTGEVPSVPWVAALDNGVLHLEIELRENEQSSRHACDIELTRFAGKAVEIQVQDLEFNSMVVVFQVFNNYNYANGAPSKSAVNGAKRIARVFVSEDGKDADVLWLTRVDPREDLIEREPGESHMTAATKHSEYAKRIFDKYKKKSALVAEVDVRDSVAYLEAQVDALTRYVLAIHAKDGGVPDSLREILEAADAESVLDIKSSEKLIGEMKHKKHVRQEQAKYYA